MCRYVYDDSLNQISRAYPMIRYTNRRKTMQGLHVVIFYYKSTVSGLYSGASVAAASHVRAFWDIIKCDVAVKVSGVMFILSSAKTIQLFPNFKWGRGERTVSQANAHDILRSHKLTFFWFKKKTGLKLKINACDNVN